MSNLALDLGLHLVCIPLFMFQLESNLDGEISC